MADASAHDRTEQPTARRRDEARDKGQVAASADVSQAVLLLVGLAVLWFLTDTLSGSLRGMLRYQLSALAYEEWTIGHSVLLFRSLFGQGLRMLLPMLLIMMGSAVAVNVVQTGWHITSEPLTVKWDRISLSQNWSKLFSVRAAVRGVMVLLKLSMGLSLSVWWLYSDRHRVITIGHQNLASSIEETWRTSLNVGFVLGGTLLLIGTIDFLFQRWQHEQDLKMTRQEVRDEIKRDEGDPHVKSRMKKLAREAAKNQMLRQVPTATVILTNPTHIAVALTYDRQTMAAPRVVAKGTGTLAKRITTIAKEHRIPVLERKPLARALFASVEVDQEIPPNLFRAIAEILAVIYELKPAA